MISQLNSIGLILNLLNITLKYDWNYYEDDCKGNLKVDVFVASTIARFQQMDYDGIVVKEVVFMAIVNIWGYVSCRKSELWLKWLWRWLPGHFWAKIVEWSSRVFIGYRKPMARRKPSYYLNIKFASKMRIITATTIINYHRGVWILEMCPDNLERVRMI